MDSHDRVAALPALLHEVQEARVGLSAQRQVGHRHTDLPVARAALLAALERYADALVASGRPVPYRLRDELQLLRELRYR